MRRFCLFTVGFVFLSAAVAEAQSSNPSWPNTSATRAELALPENWPSDTGYGYVSEGTCPSGPMMGQMVERPQAGQWELWGFYPPDTTDPCGDSSVLAWQLDETLPTNDASQERQKMNGTGMSVDVAWTMTIGDPHVITAIHDSGAEWYNTDLVNKWYLNEGELPMPELANGTSCGKYDCNGDGVFNVLDYTSGSGHDQPTVAIITDPRITGYQCSGNAGCQGDTNGNGILDPEDLIRIFSNGIDEDADGFTDDICGWDFYWGDNDPSDDVQFGHGTGEAEDSAAETNNGIGTAGVCPECRVIPVRVGDSYIADTDHFAEGVYFSLGQGASIIQEALGGLNNTPLMQSAIDAAYNSGVIVVASAADEDSLHHNYPAAAEHTLNVHAVTYDTDNNNTPQIAHSFVRYNNCTNAGGHLVLSTPGDQCSSEATGKSSGEAGLLYSAWRDNYPHAPPLAAGEVMQLMWMSNEDINIPGSATNTELYPSGPGWDTYFGYGRNDAGAAVKMVMNGQIPPVIDITAPLWFETFDPTQQPKITIAGTVSATRASSYDFIVSVAPGLNPAPSAFTQVASTTGATKTTTGTLAMADITKFYADPSAASMDPNAYAGTVVIQAVAHYGGSIGDVQGLFRKSFFVHRDPDLFKGFPIYLGTSGDSSPHFVDLNGDGHDTLVIATSDGRVHAFQADGKELKGWPVKVDQLVDVAALPNVPAFSPTGPTANTAQAIASTVAVGSLNGDGKLQVVISTMDGQLYAWNADGSLVAGFPVKADPSHYLDGTHDTTLQDGTQVSYVLGRGFFATPALYDLGGDGHLEIIQPGEDGWLYVWDSKGEPYPGFPVEVYDPKGGNNGSTQQIIHGKLMASPAVGDITGDGTPSIVVSSNENYGTTETRSYAIWHDGNNHAGGPYLPNWPLAVAAGSNHDLPDIATGNSNTAAIATIDGQTMIEISPVSATPIFYDYTGKQLGSSDIETTGAKATTQDTPYFAVVNSGSFGILGTDGKLAFVDGTIGFNYAENGIDNATRIPPSHAVSAWGVEAGYSPVPGWTAEPLPGFPALTTDFQFFMNYTIADVDGDGQNEILSGNGVYLVTAFRADGSQPSGWPKNTGGWVIGTPAVGDLDGDGYIDVADMTREGWLFVWHGKGKANEKIEWESFHHDAQNTSNYNTPLPTRHGPLPAGCHCGLAGGDTWLGLLIGIGALRRRRRSA